MNVQDQIDNLQAQLNALPQQILFTQSTEEPVDSSVCPNGTQRLRVFCPGSSVLVAAQCSIEPPISNLQQTPNFIEINQEIDRQAGEDRYE